MTSALDVATARLHAQHLVRPLKTPAAVVEHLPRGQRFFMSQGFAQSLKFDSSWLPTLTTVLPSNARSRGLP